MLSTRLKAASKQANISSLTYVSNNSTDRASSSTAFTYTAQNIGTANSNRIVIVGVGLFNAGSAVASISSLTVGGNTATSIVDNLFNFSATRVAIYAIAVSSGSTADIVVNLSGNATTCGIGVYSMVSSSLTVTASNTASAGIVTGTSVSTNITTNLDAAVVGFLYGVNNGATTWTGLTEDFDIDTRSTENFSGAKLYPSTTSGSLTVSATKASGQAGGLAIASWN